MSYTDPGWVSQFDRSHRGRVRALMKKYHPDLWRGEAEVAETRANGNEALPRCAIRRRRA